MIYLKQYYQGNMKILSYGFDNISEERGNESVIIYRTRLGKWIRVDNGEVLFTLSDAYDFLDYATQQNNNKTPNRFICSYIDEDSIVPISMTKQTTKTLRKQYQQRKMNQ